MINPEMEIKQLFTKLLYDDALYLHYIHKGYTVDRAKLESVRRTKNKINEY